jgi:hypothetical protein
VAAVYDFNDNLHIVWVTSSADATYDNTLWHWSEGTGVSKVATNRVQTANPGTFMLSINKMTLGVGANPADTAYNYLYLLYSKYSDDDASAAGNANSEVYLKASTNAGASWGPEINLTNTPSDNCLPGECHSEVYASIAERVDSFLYVFYLDDKDAGAYFFSTAEGEATLNAARYIKYPRPLVPAIANMVYSPGQMITPARWATNGGSTADSMKFDNAGTATLYVQISGPTYVNISPINFNIAELGSTQTVNLTFNGAGLADTFLVDSLKILSNHDTSGVIYSDTQYLKFHFVVTDTFYYPEFDSVDAGRLKTMVSNIGNIGNQQDGWMMNFDGYDFLFEFTPVFVTPDFGGYGPVGFTWLHEHNDFLAEANLVIEPGVPKAQLPWKKPIVIKDKFALPFPGRLNAGVPYWDLWGYWTKYSKIIIDPGNFPCPNWIKIKNWWKWNPPPKWWNDLTGPTTPLPGYFGIGADWDVPAEASGKNKGGYDDVMGLIWQKADTIAFNNYYGSFLFLSAAVIKGGDTTYKGTAPLGAHVLRNKTQLYPSGGYNDDSLYKYMSTPGWSVEQDSAQDMNILMSMAYEPAPNATSVIALEYALIVSDVGLDSLKRIASALKKGPGDANADGKVTVSDVVYLINYLFKGGPEPWLAYSDANGDGKVTVSDVVYLINYLFKGGAAPVIPLWDDWSW